MCVRALYQVEDKFEIPKEIDLDNKAQVKCYEVKDHILIVYMVNGKEIKIKGQCDQPYLNPYPNELIYEEDDEAEEEEEEEEEVRGVCDECEQEGKFIGTEGDLWVCPACLEGRNDEAEEEEEED